MPGNRTPVASLRGRMILYDHSRRLSEPLKWGRRERSAVALLSCAALIGLAALGTFALTTGAPARKDCVSVTFASTLGGAELNACGERARAVCASASTFRGIAAALEAACRRAGFPVDPSR
jgi:hypothetical protein